MTARKIDIPDELWGKVRVRAFETNTTAAAITQQALTAWLAGPQTKASKVGIGGTVKKSHMEGETRVIDEVQLMEVSIVADTPENRAAGSHPITVRDDPTAGDFTLEHSADGQQVITPKETPKMISTPEEASRVAASIPAFHPAPKPSAQKKTRR